MTQNSALPFASALLLASHEDYVVVERNALKTEGLRQIRVATKGLDIVRQFAKETQKSLPPSSEVIICAPELEDMDAMTFVKLLRAHPLLVHLPLILVSSAKPGEAEKLLVENGFNAVLPRPFTRATLQSVCQQVYDTSKARRAAIVQQVQETKTIPSLEEFNKRLAVIESVQKENLDGEQAYRQGIAFLKAKEYEKALPLLQKATVEVAWSADANIALAGVWHMRKEEDKAQEALQEGIRACIYMGAWEKAQYIAGKLAPFWQMAQKTYPFLREREAAIRHGDMTLAARILTAFEDFFPEDEAAQVENLYKTCLSHEDALKAVQDLAAAFTRENMPELAKKLTEKQSQKLPNTHAGKEAKQKKSKKPKAEKSGKNLPEEDDEDWDEEGDEGPDAMERADKAVFGDPTFSIEPLSGVDTLEKPARCDAWAVVLMVIRLYRRKKKQK